MEIDDITFELFAMHCGIGRGIRQKKISQEKLSYRKYNKLIVSLESPNQPECICFFLKCDIVYLKACIKNILNYEAIRTRKEVIITGLLQYQYILITNQI